MNDKDSLLTSPQLDNYEQRALVLSSKQIYNLYKQSKASNVPLEILEKVYIRGYAEAAFNKELSGFGRVSSFLHGGVAARLDADLLEVVVGEPQSSNPNEPSARFVGTDSLNKILRSETPGQESRADIIKRVVKDQINSSKKDPE